MALNSKKANKIDRRVRFLLVSVFSLLFSLMMSACGKLTSDCLVSPYGLISWWDGDQVSNGISLDRNSLNPGTLYNSTIAQGLYKYAFSFESNNSWLEIPDSPSLKVSGAFTILARVKIPTTLSLAGARTLIGKGVRASLVSSSQFETRDLTTILSNARGTTSAIFDGKYIYFIPGYNNTVPDGYIVRYNTNSSETFAASTTSDSWSMIQLDSSSLYPGTGLGLGGGTFDGRYIYLYSTLNSQIFRYDTQTTENFTSATKTSWKMKDTIRPLLQGSLSGYSGSAYDGRYIYFISNSNSQGIIARYDTQTTEAFESSTNTSWQFFDVQTLAGQNSTSFVGIIFDGRYIYLLPSDLSLIARYDTQSTETFSAGTLKSWNFRDLSLIGGSSAVGYSGGAFDGRYIYLAPKTFSTVARYDTQSTEDFNTATTNSWSFLNLVSVTSAVNVYSNGYEGAVFDGKFVHFVPRNNPVLTVYNTKSTETFSRSTQNSWSFFNLASLSQSINATALSYFSGGAFDGRYVYYSPWNEGNALQFIRYDTNGGKTPIELKISNQTGDSHSNSLLGPSIQITTASGFFKAVSVKPIDSAWHFLAGIYDGSSLKMYVDGSLSLSQNAAGLLVDNSTPLTIGSIYENSISSGALIDEVQLYSRALSITEIQNIQNTGLCK